MSMVAERAAIETRFKTQWMVGSALRTSVGYDGQTWAPVTGQSGVRLTIRNGDGFNASMGDPGANLVRYVGVLFLQIFVPGGQAGQAPSLAARTYADLIRPIFTNWRSDDRSLLFRTMNVGTAEEIAPHYMLPVSFPFYRDELHG